MTGSQYAARLRKLTSTGVCEFSLIAQAFRAHQLFMYVYFAVYSEEQKKYLGSYDSPLKPEVSCPLKLARVRAKWCRTAQQYIFVMNNILREDVSAMPGKMGLLEALKPSVDIKDYVLRKEPFLSGKFTVCPVAKGTTVLKPADGEASKIYWCACENLLMTIVCVHFYCFVLILANVCSSICDETFKWSRPSRVVKHLFNPKHHAAIKASMTAEGTKRQQGL